MSLVHTIPSDLVIADNLRRGTKNNGVLITKYLSGGFGSRDFSNGETAAFQLDFTDFADSTTKLRQLRTFLRHVNGQLTSFALVDPIIKHNERVRCDAPADGTQTTFHVPIRPDSQTELDDMHVFAADAPQHSGYTSHLRSNLLTDDQASLISGTTGLTDTGTSVMSRSDMMSADGIYSAKVATSAASGGVTMAPSSSYVPATPAQDYTGYGRFLGTGDFKVGLLFYDVGLGILGGGWTYGTPITGTETEFTHAYYTMTAPANTVWARSQWIRDTVSSDTFFVDTMGIFPGDTIKWRLPSQCGSLVEFAAAPDVNTLIEASMEGQWLPYLKLMKKIVEWQEIGEGDALVRRLIMEEDIE